MISKDDFSNNVLSFAIFAQLKNIWSKCMRPYENDWINICMYISWIAYHEEWKIFKLSHCSPWYDLAHLIWAHIWKVMHWVASQQGYSTHASPVFAHHSSFPHLGIGDFFIKRIFSHFAKHFEKDWTVRKNVQIWSAHFFLTSQSFSKMMQNVKISFW